jgi:Domain of unknown function (DUF927)
MIGASVISPQLERMEQSAVTAHAQGDSTTGKTITAKTAAGVWTKIDLNPPNWDTTLKALVARLVQAGGMSLLLDETGVCADDKFLASAVMLISDGHERARATQTGGLAETGTWCSVVLSTGERGLLESARVGGAARVVQLQGPFMPDAETADQVLALANEAHGWPGRWLTSSPWPKPQLPALQCKSAVGKRAAKSVAACAAGFAELARIVGVGVDAQEIGQAVLDEMSDSIEEAGETAGLRFWSALEHDLASNPALYPPRHDAQSLILV